MEKLASNQSRLSHGHCLVINFSGRFLNPCLAPSVEDVVALFLLLRWAVLICWLDCLCRVGCRHLQVALVDRSMCVIFVSCKESSAVSRVSGPLKAGFPLLWHTWQRLLVSAWAVGQEPIWHSLSPKKRTKIKRTAFLHRNSKIYYYGFFHMCSYCT